MSARDTGVGWETSRSGAGALLLCQALGCSPAALNKAACDLRNASASPSSGAGAALLPAPPLRGPARPAGPRAGAVPGARAGAGAGAEVRPEGLAPSCVPLSWRRAAVRRRRLSASGAGHVSRGRHEPRT